MSDNKWPAYVIVWVCPNCGQWVTRPYVISEGRARCTKTTHTRRLIAARYDFVRVLEDA